MRDKPFTLNQRKRLCRQDGYGHRCTNDWHQGDLPAPFAEGDQIFVPEGGTNNRMDHMGWGYFVVTAGFSIDEGDAWYFRISNDLGKNWDGSDRLHVNWAERSNWPESVNWMSGSKKFNGREIGWDLIETSDPEGLALRGKKLREGWSFTKRHECPTCGIEH